MKTKLVFALSTLSMLFLISSCNSQLGICDSSGVGLISNSSSRILADNYKATLTNSYNKINPNLESRSVWFSYEEMAKYMCIIAKEYKTQNPEGNADLSKLGIRIYFGKYPTQDDLRLNPDFEIIYNKNLEANRNRNSSEPSVEYGEKKCVFFVPTHEVKGKYGYYQEDFMLDSLKTDEKAPSGILLPGINKNHGALAPPEKIEGAIYLQNNQQSQTNDGN